MNKSLLERLLDYYHIDYQKYLEIQIQKDEFRKEWEALEPEYAIMKAILDARTSQGLTQKELAEKSGINQANISKLEKGNCNVTIKTIDKLLRSMGHKLRIEAV